MASRILIRPKLVAILWICSLVCLPASTLAQIVTDGSLGTAGPTTLTGPDLQIGADLGQTVCNDANATCNVFHSFSQFNVNSGETATFTGPAGIDPAAVANVFARVSGSSPSNIAGLLRTSGIPNADFYLMNPNGVVFGPGATLDIGGSFVVTTANELRMADGQVFVATPNPGTDALLTTAAPSAFGFLPPQNPQGDPSPPSAVVINESDLGVGVGESISIVSGDIEMNDGDLTAPSGRVNLVSVASPGEVDFDADPHVPSIDLDAFEQLNSVEVLDHSEIVTAGQPGGTVFVRAGHLVLKGSTSTSRTDGDADHPGLGVDIHLTGDLTVDEGEIASSSSRRGESGLGRAGGIRIIAEGSVTVINGPLDNFIDANIGSRAFSLGPAGDVEIITGQLILDDGFIQSASLGGGKAGNLTIQADDIELVQGSGNAFIGTFSGSSGDLPVSPGDAGDIVITAKRFVGRGAGVFSQSQGAGAAGNITMDVETIELLDVAQINASISDGARDAGDINVTADRILISDVDADGFGSGFFSSVSGESGSGNAGTISITANELTLQSGGRVQTASSGIGNGGDIILDVSELSIIDQAFLFSSTFGSGLAGNVDVTADSIVMDGSFPTGVFARAFAGAARGGDVRVTAQNLLQLDNGAMIDASTFSAADAGNVTIFVETGNLVVLGPSFIAASAFFNGTGAPGGQGGSAGTLDVTAPHIAITGLETIGSTDEIGGLFSTSGPAGGSGGDVTVTADSLRIQNFGVASASSNGSGQGGDITLDVDVLELLDGGSISSNANASGDGGDVTVTAKTVTVAGFSHGEIAFNTGGSGLLPSQIAAEALSSQTASSAGDLHVEAQTIHLLDGGKLLARTFGNGQAGDIDVVAEDLRVSGFNIDVLNAPLTQGIDPLFASAGIDSSTASVVDDMPTQGTAGQVYVSAKTLEIADRGFISSRSFSQGPGNIVQVTAEQIMIRDEATVTASSQNLTGQAGKVTVTSLGDIVLRDGGSVTTASENFTGGDIAVTAGTTIDLFNDSTISAEAGGNGGNIKLTAPRRVQLVDSTLTAQAGENGAKIEIDPQFVILRNSVINGLSEGEPVEVFIDPNAIFLNSNSQILTSAATLPPELDLSGSLASFPVSLLRSYIKLDPGCAAQFARDTSSFMRQGQGGIPLRIDGWVPVVNLAQLRDRSAARDTAHAPPRTGTQTERDRNGRASDQRPQSSRSRRPGLPRR